MSTAVRTALANAANTVSGVKVQPYYTQSTAPSVGWVRLDITNRAENGRGFMDTWQVCVVLPQSLAAAEKWVEENREALINALEQVITVQSVQPQQLVLEGGVVCPALVIEGTRASE